MKRSSAGRDSRDVLSCAMALQDDIVCFIDACGTKTISSLMRSRVRARDYYVEPWESFKEKGHACTAQSPDTKNIRNAAMSNLLRVTQALSDISPDSSIPFLHHLPRIALN
jgi:hypothetical protein